MNLEPSTQTVQLRCRACRGLSDGRMLTGVPVTVSVAAMKEMFCPHCGAGYDKLSFGQNRTTAEDDRFRSAGPASSVADRAADWRANGEIGDSALAVHAAMRGARGGRDHPHDAGDLHRCMLLLRRIPEWEAGIARMADRSPEWRALVAVWPELASTFREEAGADWGAWPRPRTAAIMKRTLEGVGA